MVALRMDEHGLEPYLLGGNANWHNSVFPQDVNERDGATPIDALLVINELSRRAASNIETGAVRTDLYPSAYLDVDDNGYISPLDALLIINALPRDIDPENRTSVVISLEPAEMSSVQDLRSVILTAESESARERAIGTSPWTRRRRLVKALSDEGVYTDIAFAFLAEGKGRN